MILFVFGYVCPFLDTIFGYTHSVFWIRVYVVLDTFFCVLDTFGYAYFAAVVVKNIQISTRLPRFWIRVSKTFLNSDFFGYAAILYERY